MINFTLLFKESHDSKDSLITNDGVVNLTGKKKEAAWVGSAVEQVIPAGTSADEASVCPPLTHPTTEAANRSCYISTSLCHVMLCYSRSFLRFLAHCSKCQNDAALKQVVSHHMLPDVNGPFQRASSYGRPRSLTRSHRSRRRRHCAVKMKCFSPSRKCG